MKFDNKTIITIVCSVAGVLLLAGIIGFASHARYEGKWFENGRWFSRGFENASCEGNFTRWNQTQMMSWIDAIITSKDYTAFQTLFTGTRMIQDINTPEKFAIRVELQTAIKKMQDLTAQLLSGNKANLWPMMIFGGKQERERWENFMGGKNMRKRLWVIGCY